MPFPRRITKKEQAFYDQEFQLTKDWPPEWRHFICWNCGADYATRSGPLMFDPCGTCGQYVGQITSMKVSYR